MKAVKSTCLYIALLLFAAAPCMAEDYAKMVADYKTAGNAIVDMVNTNTVDQVKVDALVLDITKISVKTAQAYIVKYPAGKALLEEVINNAAVLSGGEVTALGPMRQETFQQISDRWHDLGFAKAKDFGVDVAQEDNEHFTDPLHAMIHPLMVAVAAQEKNYAAMKAEMDEGLEQIELTVQKL